MPQDVGGTIYIKYCKLLQIFKKCHMTCTFGAKNEFLIFFVNDDEIIFDFKKACQMTFSKTQRNDQLFALAFSEGVYNYY